MTAIFGDPSWGRRKECQCAAEDIDPRKCLGGEEPLVCYGKRIPQSGNVRGLLGVFGGVAEAMDLGKKCQKYAYAKATGTVEVYTGIPINGLNPLSLDIIKLEGRLLLGPKCKCKPTKKDKCPKKCAKNKRYKSPKKKNRIGGHLMILGFVYKRFGMCVLLVHACGKAIAVWEGNDTIAKGAIRAMMYMSIRSMKHIQVPFTVSHIILLFARARAFAAWVKMKCPCDRERRLQQSF